MMCRSVLVIFLTASTCAAQAAPAPPQGPRLIRLAPSSSVKQVGAFRYRLLPDPLDRTPGNAAPLWRFASDAFREADHKMTNQESDWAHTPLQKLPRKEVRALLAHYTATLHLARQAACRERCDWELPPLTIQAIQEHLPLGMLQSCRTLAALLCIQYRLQLVEGRFDDAAETLQTGFALAHHLGGEGMLIQNLVGIAIGAIMLGQVEEWVQTPGSPNLYWALTALPRPFCDARRSIELELNTVHRSFPGLRRLRRETLTERQAEELAKEVFRYLSKATDDKAVPQRARQHLLDLGRTDKEIDALPKTQVLLLWYVEEYDRVRDDVSKALTVPTWQALPMLEATFKETRKAENVLLRLLMPALAKTWEAYKRSERQFAGLRCAEALRLYAAAHKGQAPEKWSDITDVPLPLDPVTGKGFDDFYHKTKDGGGVVEAPAPPGTPAIVGRRYELPPCR
jgi:hypothetical protein